MIDFISLFFFCKLCRWKCHSYISGKNKTPSRGSKTPKTPSGADRFIPNRSATQFDLGHYKMMNSDNNEERNGEEMMSPSQKHYQKAMSDNLNGDNMSSKIIAYKNKAPQAPEGKAYQFTTVKANF